MSQLDYGPLADAYGRRSVLNFALGLFVVASVLCVFAPTFEVFLLGRALQGVAAAATRVIATAVVRDLTSGRRMAQVMSMAMTLFMIVPIIAPGLGQLILLAAPWRWIFGALLIYAALLLGWTLLRLPETLHADNTTPFRVRAVARAYACVLRERQTLGYMVATMFLVSCMFAYITSSEQIFVDTYGLGPLFPLAFAGVAVAISCGTFLNSRIVVRHGMRRISHTMLIVFTALTALLAVIAAAGLASFWVFMALIALALGVTGMVAANFNALGMEPVGRVAGSASALFGAVTATGGAVFGAVIARGFDGTVLPFALGLSLASGCALCAVLWTERGKLFVG
ncbi:MAG: MFS transporter [Hyphomonadaceae bacterium]|nr:MFS transporter [Hyphomonadaceae bacterium]